MARHCAVNNRSGTALNHRRKSSYLITIMQGLRCDVTCDVDDDNVCDVCKSSVTDRPVLSMLFETENGGVCEGCARKLFDFHKTRDLDLDAPMIFWDLVAAYVSRWLPWI